MEGSIHDTTTLTTAIAPSSAEGKGAVPAFNEAYTGAYTFCKLKLDTSINK